MSNKKRRNTNNKRDTDKNKKDNNPLSDYTKIYLTCFTVFSFVIYFIKNINDIAPLSLYNPLPHLLGEYLEYIICGLYSFIAVSFSIFCKIIRKVDNKAKLGILQIIIVILAIISLIALFLLTTYKSFVFSLLFILFGYLAYCDYEKYKLKKIKMYFLLFITLTFFFLSFHYNYQTK